MFDNIIKFFKKFKRSEKEESKSTAKERLHLVLAQDRANISADFLEMMKQEILEVIKKYIDIDEKAIDVRLTNKESEDGVMGAPALYANIPIITIKNEARKLEGTIKKDEEKKENIVQDDEIKKQEEVNNDNIDNEITDNTDNTKNADNKPITENEEKVEDIEDNSNKSEEIDVGEENKKDDEIKQKKNNKDKVDEVKDEEKNS